VVAVEARTRLELRFWDDPHQTWITCLSTDWAYGTTGNSQWGPTGPAAYLDYSGPACGPGWYATRTYAEIHRLYSNYDIFWYWYGGSTTSGYEWADQ